MNLVSSASLLLLKYSAYFYKQCNKNLSARPWSNQQLRRMSNLVLGDVVNVSAWQDSDKQGSKYQHYFKNCKSYAITNYKGSRADGLYDISNIKTLEYDLSCKASFEHTFDCVLNHTTLEHIFDIDTALDNLVNLTRDLLVLIVPYYQAFHQEHGSYGDYLRFSPLYLYQAMKARSITPMVITTNTNPVFPNYVFCIASKNPLLNLKIQELYSKDNLLVNQVWKNLESLPHVLTSRPFLV